MSAGAEFVFSDMREQKASGKCFDQRTVIFGSGAGPRLVSVCSIR